MAKGVTRSSARSVGRESKRRLLDDVKNIHILESSNAFTTVSRHKRFLRNHGLSSTILAKAQPWKSLRNWNREEVFVGIPSTNIDILWPGLERYGKIPYSEHREPDGIPGERGKGWPHQYKTDRKMACPFGGLP
jgi:hypothetical protein